MPHTPQDWTRLGVTLVVILVVMALRMRRVGKARPLKLENLWIIPAIYAVIVAAVFAVHPPHGIVWLYCAITAAVGAGLGWYRGRMMHITVDPNTHRLDQTASPMAMLFIIVLVAVRFASRSISEQMGDSGFGLMAATDLLMALSLGFIVAQRVEMGLRARRLLAAARAARR